MDTPLVIALSLGMLAGIALTALLTPRLGGTALANHPVVPRSARVGVPLAIWACGALFVFSNSSVGAKVVLRAQTFEKTIVEFSLFEFSLINTIHDMFEAKVYLLSFLVFVWSGLFPYLKLVMMLTIWYVPKERIHIAHRRRILLALDLIGRWSMIDTFLMCLLSCAFRFHITTNTIEVVRNVKDLLTVDVIVTSEAGLFTFVTSVALSLVLNTTLLAFHRNAVGYDGENDGSFVGKSVHRHRLRIEEEDGRDDTLEVSKTAALLGAARTDDEEEDDDDDASWDMTREEEDDLLATHRDRTSCLTCPRGNWFDVGTAFSLITPSTTSTEMESQLSPATIIRHHRRAKLISYRRYSVVELRSLTRLECLWLRLFILLQGLLLLAASSIDSFEFVFRGLAGELIGWADPPSQTRKNSLLSIASALGAEDETTNPAEVAYIQTTYLVFAFAFPMVVVLASYALLFARLTLRESKLLLLFYEVVVAWASVDVFIMSVLAALLEINQFSHFLEGPLCDPIKRMLKVDDCFNVDTKLLSGCVLLIICAVNFWILAGYSRLQAERAIAAREREVMVRWRKGMLNDDDDVARERVA